MTQDPTLTTFLEDLDERHVEKTQFHKLDQLLEVLARSESPDSLRLFFWFIWKALHQHPELEEALLHEWRPKQQTLAQLLEDAGITEVPTVLSLASKSDGSKKHLIRLFALADELGNIGYLGDKNNLIERAARMPMVVFLAEQQLDQLIEAVAQGRQWKDPAEILDPDGTHEIDIESLESIIALAQGRIVKTGGSGEALNLVMLRLLNWADQEKPN